MCLEGKFRTDLDEQFYRVRWAASNMGTVFCGLSGLYRNIYRSYQLINFFVNFIR